MRLTVVNKRLQWDDGTPCILAHADSPESRLHPNYRTAFSTECRLLPSYGINCITVTMRGDDVTAITPYTDGVLDIGKLNVWHVQLKEFLTECAKNGLRGVIIAYLGERTNFNSISEAKYKEWIDAMAPIFSDIAGQMIFGWEEIGQGWSMQQVATWSNPIVDYLKQKLGCLTMLHNNPGQKPWTVNSRADVMCIQETAASIMGTSGVAAFNAGYAVHLHEWYGGFKISYGQTANLSALNTFLNQAKGQTSGYGIFASDYDTGAIDATKLEYLYRELARRLSTVPQPTLELVTSTQITDSALILNGNYKLQLQ